MTNANKTPDNSEQSEQAPDNLYASFLEAARTRPLLRGEEPEFAKIKEVSRLVRKSPAQVRRLIKEGKFPTPTYVGRSPMWSYASIRRWLCGGK